jgi:hypothetical protein
MAQFTGTETPLGVTTTYTSAERMSNNHDRIVGTVFSDVAGSLEVQQGTRGADGVIDWDVKTTVAVTASTGAEINVPLVAPKWRLVFTHAGTQTVFRLFARATADGEEA